MTQEELTVGCRDECGRHIPIDKLEGSGWEYLPIQKRYRCTECWRVLNTANAAYSAQEDAERKGQQC